MILSHLGLAQAAIGFGWCTLEHPPQVKDFDREKFVGNWYEIYSDFNMLNTFGRECVINTYTPNRLSAKEDAMYIERKYTHRLWGGESD